MKFGVVEYSSKTGTVWRHRDDHPNYLADPAREMDPTSFGCYVSAMRGEHIPLLGLITGPVNHVSPLRRLHRKMIKRLTASWPTNYDLSYLQSFDALLVVHQISDGHEMTAFVKRLKKLFPHICIIGVPTQPYGILEDHWGKNPIWLTDFQDFMATCDVFISIVKSTVPLWQRLSRAPVEYLPQPYPTAFASTFFSPQSEKKPIIYVAGVPMRQEITRGYIVAKKLQERFPEYLVQLTEVNDDPVAPQLLEGLRFEKIPFQEWREHLQHQRAVTLVINTDYTQTRGRVQVDCAAVGTPSIGANSDGQVDLFPALPASRQTSIDQLVDQGTKLLSDATFYAATAAAAHERLSVYDYTPSQQRLVSLIEKYRPKQ